MLGMFPIYAVMSIAGWILVGVPFALAVPARQVSCLAWPVVVLLGAALGLLAMFLVLILLLAHQGSLRSFSLDHTEIFWLFSMLVSTVSFLVYAALLRWRLPK